MDFETTDAYDSDEYDELDSDGNVIQREHADHDRDISLESESDTEVAGLQDISPASNEDVFVDDDVGVDVKNDDVGVDVGNDDDAGYKADSEDE